MKLSNLLIISLLAALLVAAGLLLVPLFPLLPTPAMRSLVLAPVYAVFVSVLLHRANFPGALLLFSLVIGLLLMLFTPLLLPVTLASGAISEGVGWTMGRFSGFRPWLRLRAARNTASALFPALQFPLMLYGLAMVGGSRGVVLLHPLLVLGLTGAGVVLGVAGCRLGREVTKRFRAGKAVSTPEQPSE